MRAMRRDTPEHSTAPTAAAARPDDFRWPVRVYWEDTDGGGVVFYANYLKYFERARTEWLRSLGVSQERLRVDEGVLFVVTDTAVQYRAPARLDDELDVSVSVLHAGRASVEIDQSARRGTELLARGRIRIGCVDAGDFRPRRLPTHLYERLQQ
jgi:acyl-CoA thioester hydrolase